MRSLPTCRDYPSSTVGHDDRKKYFLLILFCSILRILFNSILSSLFRSAPVAARLVVSPVARGPRLPAVLQDLRPFYADVRRGPVVPGRGHGRARRPGRARRMPGGPQVS